MLDPDIRENLEQQERARRAKEQDAMQGAVDLAELASQQQPLPANAVRKPAPLDDGAALHIERKGSELRVYVTLPRGVTGTRGGGPRWSPKTMAQADAVAKLLGAVERQKGNPETGARVYRLPETSWERL